MVIGSVSYFVVFMLLMSMIAIDNMRRDVVMKAT